MQHRFDLDRKPTSVGRLPQLNKRNSQLRRESEAITLWRRIERQPARDLFGLR